MPSVAGVPERVDLITRELETSADADRAAAMARYMKTSMPFHGVPRPTLDAIAAHHSLLPLPAQAGRHIGQGR